MAKPRILANTVSNGGPLADGAIAASEVSGLANVATSGSYNDLSDKPSIPGAPGLDLIAVHNFSGSLTYNLENFSSTYDDYLLVVSNVNPASTAAFSARLKVGGTYPTTSNYRMHVSKGSSASSSYSAWNSSSLPYITLSGASAVAANRGTFMIKAFGVNNSSRYPTIFWDGTFSDASNLYTVNGSADIPVTGALEGIQLLAGDGSTTNIGGTVRVYGYKKSV